MNCATGPSGPGRSRPPSSSKPSARQHRHLAASCQALREPLHQVVLLLGVHLDRVANFRGVDQVRARGARRQRASSRRPACGAAGRTSATARPMRDAHGDEHRGARVVEPRAGASGTCAPGSARSSTGSNWRFRSAFWSAYSTRSSSSVIAPLSIRLRAASPFISRRRRSRPRDRRDITVPMGMPSARAHVGVGHVLERHEQQHLALLGRERSERALQVEHVERWSRVGSGAASVPRRSPPSGAILRAFNWFTNTLCMMENSQARRSPRRATGGTCAPRARACPARGRRRRRGRPTSARA